MIRYHPILFHVLFCTRSVLYIESAEKILNRPGPARPAPTRPGLAGPGENAIINYTCTDLVTFFLASEKESRICQIATRALRGVFFLSRGFSTARVIYYYSRYEVRRRLLFVTS